MSAGQSSRIGSVRERNRRELTQAIVDEARSQLATHGAAGLSLRSVARELGMASSAVYRYVSSRDELLTLLIVDAHEALGAAAERAVGRAAKNGPPERFRAVAMALRRWALAHPHEYALVYGTPVPGYQGTAQTSQAGSRALTVLAGLLREAAADPSRAASAGDPEPPRILWPELTRLLASPVFARPDGQPAAIPRALLVRGVMAWVELVGLINFELFGQFADSIERTGQFYLHAVNVMIGDLF